MKISKLILIILISLSCSKNKTNSSDDGWVSLTDGKTFNNWHTYLSDSVIGWYIEDGAFVLNPGVGSSNNGLVSNKSYTNFILSLEWKVEKNGNSGVFWAVNENEKYSVPYLSAAEIQVIDDDVYEKKIVYKPTDLPKRDYDPRTDPNALLQRGSGITGGLKTAGKGILEMALMPFLPKPVRTAWSGYKRAKQLEGLAKTTGILDKDIVPTLNLSIKF